MPDRFWADFITNISRWRSALEPIVVDHADAGEARVNPLTRGPLSDAEIEALDQFLLAAETLEESMDISTLDGYLTAIVCGPATILPSEWLRWVWDMQNGEDSPEFESQDQAQRILELLMRHMNSINQTLKDAPEHYEPLLMENPNHGDPVPVIDEWCMGFMKGIALDSEGWLPVLAGEPEWVSTMILYGTEDGWEALKRKNLSLDQHKALAAGLADSVRQLHAFWMAQRRNQLSAGVHPKVVLREPIRNTTKVGRNDPCSCGSGKKFKHCHGAPKALH